MDPKLIELSDKLISSVKISNFEIIIQALTLVVLSLTGIAILWYTKETQRIRILSAHPVIKIINTRSNGSFNIKNIGKGPAINIEIRISQVHKNGGRTNLRNLLEQDQQRHFLNLGENESTDTKGNEITNKYVSAVDQDFSHGVKDVFELILICEDIFKNKYFTVSLFKVVNNDYILKKTFIDRYYGNNLPEVKELDWIS